MSDLTSQILIYPFGAGVYGTGVGLLTIYPQAMGSYITYLGAGGESFVADSLIGAIESAGMKLTPIGRVATPLVSTSPFYSESPIARLGNAATVDARNSIAAQYGRNIANLKMDLTAVKGFPQNTYTYANGQSFRPDLSYRTFSLWSGATAHFDEVKAVSDLTGSSKNIAQVAQYGRAMPTRANRSRASAPNSGILDKLICIVARTPSLRKLLHRISNCITCITTRAAGISKSALIRVGLIVCLSSLASPSYSVDTGGYKCSKYSSIINSLNGNMRSHYYNIASQVIDIRAHLQGTMPCNRHGCVIHISNNITKRPIVSFKIDSDSALFCRAEPFFDIIDLPINDEMKNCNGTFMYVSYLIILEKNTGTQNLSQGFVPVDHYVEIRWVHKVKGGGLDAPICLTPPTASAPGLSIESWRLMASKKSALFVYEVDSEANNRLRGSAVMVK